MPRRRTTESPSTLCPPVTRQTTHQQQRQQQQQQLLHNEVFVNNAAHDAAQSTPIFYDPMPSAASAQLPSVVVEQAVREALIVQSPLIFSSLCDDPKTRMQCETAVASSQHSPSTSAGVRKRRRSSMQNGQGQTSSSSYAPPPMVDDNTLPPPRTRSRMSSTSRQSPGASTSTHHRRPSNAAASTHQRRPSNAPTSTAPCCPHITRGTRTQHAHNCQLPRLVNAAVHTAQATTMPPLLPTMREEVNGVRQMERRMEERVRELNTRRAGYNGNALMPSHYHHHYFYPVIHEGAYYLLPTSNVASTAMHAAPLPNPFVHPPTVGASTHIPTVGVTRPNMRDDPYLVQQQYEQWLLYHQHQQALEAHHMMAQSSSSLQRLLYDPVRQGGRMAMFNMHHNPLLDHLSAVKTPKGLSKSQMEQLVTYRWPSTEKETQHCIVCMNDVAVRQTVRVMPCQHIYHARCIDKWLKTNRSCPICRHDALAAQPKPKLGEGSAR